MNLGSVAEITVCHTETDGAQIELNFPVTGNAFGKTAVCEVRKFKFQKLIKDFPHIHGASTVAE